MTINWSAIIEGITAGVAASILLAVFALSRDSIRNVILWLRIKRAFRKLGMGHGVDGVSIQVSNQIGRAFTVREVSFETSEVNFHLNATGEVTSDFKGQHPKITRKQRKMVKEGKPLRLRAEMHYRQWRSGPTPEGFTLIAPFTSHKFLLPAEIIPNVPSDVQALRLLVEYTNWSNVVKIVKISSRDSVDHISKTIANVRSQIESGQLDKARALFGVPPVLQRPVAHVAPVAMKNKQKRSRHK